MFFFYFISRIVQVHILADIYHKQFNKLLQKAIMEEKQKEIPEVYL